MATPQPQGASLMIRTLRNLLTDTKGNTLAIFAAALVPLVAMIGSGLDLSFAYMAKAKLQNACDAAVLAGRQSMDGNFWKEANEAEAHKFFDFNFPVGTMGARDVSFEVDKDPDDNAQILGKAEASIPTALMHFFGFDEIDVQANCDAKRDLGHNDVVLVLDVTGSMQDAPSSGGASKISRLRQGASGLYRALDDSDNGSVTRFGIVPYSHTVNVARSLENRDFLRDQRFKGRWKYEVCKNNRGYWRCETEYSQNRPSEGWSSDRSYYVQNLERNSSGWALVNVRYSSWARSDEDQSLTAFRTSGDGCIVERGSVGNSDDRIKPTVSRADIDNRAANGGDSLLQFGRYDPQSHFWTSTRTRNGVRFYRISGTDIQVGCPSEAQTLAEYDTLKSFEDAIDAATARVTGGTYHDVGILWGARFLSQSGFFAADNKSEIDGVGVDQHIVFMTDGALDTGEVLNSAHGIAHFDDRTEGSGSLESRHISRFQSACSAAKSMGMTIWVIALDVTDTDGVKPCATTASHFYTSDGSDLEEIFENIGRGIGNLRLTR